MQVLLTSVVRFIQRHAITGKAATWCLFGLVAALIFLKTSLFHWFLYHDWQISHQLPSAWAFWLPKISISLFVASGVFLSSKKGGMLVVLFILDLWMIANLMYFRANNCLITWDTFRIAHNIEGFESSIGFYYNWQATVYWLSTVLYALALPFFRPTRIRKVYPVILLVAGTLFLISSRLLIAEKHSERAIEPQDRWKYYIPFYEPRHFRTCWLGSAYYAKQRSIVAYLPMVISTTIVDAWGQEEITLNTAEEEKMAQLVHLSDTVIYPTHNLIFILVESFESFALEAKDTDGEYVLPHLRNLLHQPNVAYADKITSQVRHGVSADGKLIVNTGLLPLQTGVAAMEFGGNSYPNYAHLFDVALWVHPTPATAWNQQIMTYSYGYTQMLGGDKMYIPDGATFGWTQPHIDKYSDKRLCYFLTTMYSHSPFNLVAENPTLHLDPQMPHALQRYLTCLHATDSLFGVWYDAWCDTPHAEETVLVITGDHTVFKDAMLHEFSAYAAQADWSIQNGLNYCPLIIQSPTIEKNIHVSDICYQMDVYPTILPLIGAEDYFWKGFGVNLLDSTARAQRNIHEKDAYMLSDKLIRTNYFERYMP